MPPTRNVAAEELDGTTANRIGSSGDGKQKTHNPSMSDTLVATDHRRARRVIKQHAITRITALLTTALRATFDAAPVASSLFEQISKPRSIRPPPIAEFASQRAMLRVDITLPSADPDEGPLDNADETICE